MFVLQIVDNTDIPLFAFRVAFLRTYSSYVLKLCGWKHVGGFYFEKCELKNVDLRASRISTSVAWMRVRASMLACNMSAANPCTRASELPNVDQWGHTS